LATTTGKLLVARIGFTAGSMSTWSIYSTADYSPIISTNNSSVNDQLVCHSKIAGARGFNKYKCKSTSN
jgi:hypothetical protein